MPFRTSHARRPNILPGGSGATTCSVGTGASSAGRLARNAASYAARSAMWQATPLATPGAVPTRQHLDTLNRGFQEQARKSRREIPFACDAIIYEQYDILYYIVGPICRGPNGHVCASLEI